MKISNTKIKKRRAHLRNVITENSPALKPYIIIKCKSSFNMVYTYNTQRQK